MDAASFDTSSHHTVDYLLETRSAKSFTFGMASNTRYQHLKQQRPAKRSLSAQNFNWNILVDRVDKRLEHEQKKYDTFVSGQPMTKLIGILGQDLVNRIREDYSDLFDSIMGHLELKKNITYAFCKQLLSHYNLNLDEEKKIQRMQHGNDRRKNLDGSFGTHRDQQP